MSARKNIADLTAVKLELSQQDSGSFCQTHKHKEGEESDRRGAAWRVSPEGWGREPRGQAGSFWAEAEAEGPLWALASRQTLPRTYLVTQKHTWLSTRVGWLDFVTQTLVKGGNGTQRPWVKAPHLTQRLRQTKSEGTQEISLAKVFPRARSQTSSTH